MCSLEKYLFRDPVCKGVRTTTKCLMGGRKICSILRERLVNPTNTAKFWLANGVCFSPHKIDASLQPCYYSADSSMIFILVPLTWTMLRLYFKNLINSLDWLKAVLSEYFIVLIWTVWGIIIVQRNSVVLFLVPTWMMTTSDQCVSKGLFCACSQEYKGLLQPGAANNNFNSCF